MWNPGLLTSGEQQALVREAFGGSSRENSSLGTGDTTQRSTGTYPPGQQVKAEFVLAGAHVNDALETEIRRQGQQSRGVPKEGPRSPRRQQSKAKHRSLPLFEPYLHSAPWSRLPISKAPFKCHLLQEAPRPEPHLERIFCWGKDPLPDSFTRLLAGLSPSPHGIPHSTAS